MPLKTIHPSFLPTIDISVQLENLLSELRLDDLHQVHELTDKELDLLLNTIKIQTNSNISLMDYVIQNAKRNNISKQNSQAYYNLKVKILLDNLAKKMCRCTTDLATLNLKNNSYKSVVGVCRKSIFQNRGVDFVTYECDTEKKRSDGRRVFGPLLKPKIGTNLILKKYQTSNN